MKFRVSLLLFLMQSFLCGMENLHKEFLGKEWKLLQEIREQMLRCENQQEKDILMANSLAQFVENRIANNIDLNLPFYNDIAVAQTLLAFTASDDRFFFTTKKLLKHKADPNLVIYGPIIPSSNPLIVAMKANATKTIKALLKAGADPNTTFKASIVGCASEMRVSPLLYVLEYIENIGIKTITELLKAGAAPNYKVNESKESLLHFTSWFTVRAGSIAKGKKYVRATRLLLQYGAEPNLQDKLGRTPLFNIRHVVRRSSLKAFKQLLLFGADLTIKDQNGQDAIMFAQTSGNTSGAQFLKDWQDGKIKFKKKKIR